jgi:hypothetical protein
VLFVLFSIHSYYPPPPPKICAQLHVQECNSSRFIAEGPIAVRARKHVKCMPSNDFRHALLFTRVYPALSRLIILVHVSSVSVRKFYGGEIKECLLLFSRQNSSINTPCICMYYMFRLAAAIISYIEPLQSPFL